MMDDVSSAEKERTGVECVFCEAAYRGNGEKIVDKRKAVCYDEKVKCEEKKK
ncbi:MAG: hypothetical protein HFG32_00160 [Eubacterium sp.]|nr:hypothetical protein [Eubacterium sp.]